MIANGRPLEGAKVLVAEDEAILALDMMQILMQAGARVVGPAVSLERALQLAADPGLNCGVLDVRLEDELVFPAAEVLRQRGVGVIFYTAQNNIESISRDWPKAMVVSKPASAQTLTRVVAQACFASKSVEAS